MEEWAPRKEECVECAKLPWNGTDGYYLMGYQEKYRPWRKRKIYEYRIGDLLPVCRAHRDRI